MQKATAVFPASISFVFRAFLPPKLILKQKNTEVLVKTLKKWGSTGVGCTVNKKVKVTVRKSGQTLIFFNNNQIRLPTINQTERLAKIRKLKIEISSELPLGCGFGISGAATLGYLWAAKKLLGLKKSQLELTEVAHAAEILEKTGLGTVATQINGGFLVKKRAGIPSSFRRLPFSGEKLFALLLGSWETPKILADKKRLEKINQFADKAMREIRRIKNPSLPEILEISRIFCLKSGFLGRKHKSIIKKIKDSGGSACLAMVGNMIFSTVKPLDFQGEVFELLISGNNGSRAGRVK